MRRLLAAFVTGVLLVQLWPALPAPGWLCLPLVVALWACRRACPALAAGLMGLSWAVWQGQVGLAAQLPLGLEDEALQVEGRIVGLTRSDPPRLRFELRVAAVRQDRRPAPNALRRLSLSVQDAAITPAPGQYCTLYVRLRRPRGALNPGGFDYERWLFAAGIDGQGQVIAHPANHCRPGGLAGATDAARATLAARITAAVPDGEVAGILSALAVGEQARLNDRQWAVLRATGTTHMVSISGLHVSMVALAMWVLVRRGLGLVPGCHQAAPRLGLVSGLIAATGYAVLAGWTVPTQRSVLMLACMAVRRWRGHRLLDGDGLLVALALVLAMDPLASLSSSFWLSFGALAVLVMVGAVHLQTGALAGWLGAHLWLAVLLAPLLATVSPLVAWTSPLANALLVPLVTWGVVPMVLTGIALSPWWPTAAEACWQGAGELWLLVWAGLRWLADSAPPLVVDRVPSVPEALLGVLGLGALLLPLGRRRWWFALCLLGIGGVWPLPRPPAGSVAVTVLDVGQGLAVAVETHRHLLLFDAGPKTYGGRDAGEDVVLPWLRHRGHHRIDRLIVSHADADHAGGLGSILRDVPVTSLMLSPQHRWDGPVERCTAGQRWTWDGVDFEILHPPSRAPPGSSENDASCVLRIGAGAQRLLLTADIEQAAEAQLLRRPDALRADVLLVPHHGSLSSSSAAFLDAVRPQVALLSVGYLNRFGQPAPAVLARYAQRGITIVDTRESGATRLHLGPSGLRVDAYRAQAKRYWHQTGR